MIKNQIVLEAKKGERIYQLLLSHDSPLGEVYDAINEMRGYVVERIQQASEQNKTEQNAEVKNGPCVS